MKVSRFKVAVLVLLAVTVIYAVALRLDIQRYEAWKQAELEKYPQWASIIEFNPYIGTFTGGLFTIAGMIIIGSWLIVFIHRKKLSLYLLIIIVGTTVLFISPAYAGYETHER